MSRLQPGEHFKRSASPAAGWGWILVVLGVLAAVTGVGVLRGAEWARAVGIALAVLNVIIQFLFLPYSPIWSIILIGIGVFVIWALAVYQPGPRTP
ncbi:DUF7144 family membrane protein [Streptomyces sp. NPDC002514]